MVILGADLDLDGAIVKLDETGKYIDHMRYPKRAHNAKGVLKRRIDCRTLFWELKGFLDKEVILAAYLEWPGHIASNGFMRISSQHRTLGNIECALSANGVDPVYITVNDWKRNFNLVGKPKQNAKAIANRLCGMDVKPHQSVSIAEAALIARYGMRLQEKMAC